jgi:hypothetical protein
MTTKPDYAELVERLTPSVAADEIFGDAIERLRASGASLLGNALNEAMDANNALKDEAADAIASLQAERDEALSIGKVTLGVYVTPDQAKEREEHLLKIASLQAERDEALRHARLDCDATGGAHEIMKDGSYSFCVKCGETVKYPTVVERARNAEALAASLQSQLTEAREALRPFAAEAENWADSVPDDYRSLCFEPGAGHANPGSETAFTTGDLRRARAALSNLQPAGKDKL